MVKYEISNGLGTLYTIDDLAEYCRDEGWNLAGATRAAKSGAKYKYHFITPVDNE